MKTGARVRIKGDHALRGGKIKKISEKELDEIISKTLLEKGLPLDDKKIIYVRKTKIIR